MAVAAVQSSAVKNIKLYCIIATQKHQQRQQSVAHFRALFGIYISLILVLST